MVERASVLEEELTRIVGNLRERYQPSCVILFGSLARGQAREGSDIDLCLIKETDCPFLDRLRDARIAADAHEALDILVYTPGEWREMLRQGNYFVRDEILGRGRVLYGKPA
ncbi:MAG: nucleotidyltransferase domain-containing protein [Planctomycetota bacterium]